MELNWFICIWLIKSIIDLCCMNQLILVDLIECIEMNWINFNRIWMELNWIDNEQYYRVRLVWVGLSVVELSLGLDWELGLNQLRALLLIYVRRAECDPSRPATSVFDLCIHVCLEITSITSCFIPFPLDLNQFQLVVIIELIK